MRQALLPLSLVALVAVVGACSADVLEPSVPEPVDEIQSMMLAPARCTPPKITDTRDALPDGLTIAAHLDLKDAASGVFGSELEAALKSNSETRDVVAAVRKCGLPLHMADEATIGFDPDGEQLVLALEGPGLGSDKTIDCLHDAIKDKTGKSPWTKGAKACTTTLTTDDGSIAYVAGKDVIVLASKAQDAAVRKRLQGKGTALLDGTLKWARKSVEMKRSAWLAMEVPSAMAAGGMPGLQRVGASVDMAKGLDLEMSLGFASRKEAGDAAAKMKTFTSLGAMMGVPTTLMDSLVIDHKGVEVGVEVFVSPSDLEALQDLASGGGGGGGHGGHGGGPTPKPRGPGGI